MDRNTILSELNNVFIRVFPEEISLTEETSAKDVGSWNSLTHIQLIVEVEKTFNIKFTSSQITSFKTVGDLVSSIESKS